MGGIVHFAESRAADMPTPQRLPFGVEMHGIEPRPDARGSFTELFRESWAPELRPVQWSALQSHPGVLRGVHVHVRHKDFLVHYSGRSGLGLRDLRRASPTGGLAAYLELTTAVGVVIPPGVAHGLYYLEETVQFLGVSHYWEAADELGCRWDEPGLGIEWPFTAALVSPRDAQGTLAELLALVEPYQKMLAVTAPAPVVRVTPLTADT
jgi:dTDP-4-dehydrorhamnose 3,5-epimerase